MIHASVPDPPAQSVKRDGPGKLSCFRTVRAPIQLTSLISESLALGFELIHRSHQQDFG
jgi:hypothetical protein